MLFQTVCIPEQERAVLTRNGRFRSILLPGVYRFFTAPRIRLEFHRLRSFIFESKWAAIILDRHPGVVAAHFSVIETNDTEIAMIYLNDELRRMLLPASRVLLWRDAGVPSVERIAVIEQPEPSRSLEILGDTLLPADDEESLDWSVEMPHNW